MPFMLICAIYNGIKYVVFLKKATYCKIRLGFFLFFIDFYVFFTRIRSWKKSKNRWKKVKSLIESHNNYPFFPKWPLFFTVKKVIFDEKKFSNFEVLIFGGLRCGWQIIGLFREERYVLTAILSLIYFFHSFWRFFTRPTVSWKKVKMSEKK